MVGVAFVRWWGIRDSALEFWLSVGGVVVGGDRREIESARIGENEFFACELVVLVEGGVVREMSLTFIGENEFEL